MFFDFGAEEFWHDIDVFFTSFTCVNIVERMAFSKDEIFAQKICFITAFFVVL